MTELGQQISWNPTGPTRTTTPTPTPTLGMGLSCNFVNVYTIVYHVQYEHVHVYTRASPTDILARISARVGQKSADKWRAERRAAAGRLPRAPDTPTSHVTLEVPKIGFRTK